MNRTDGASKRCRLFAGIAVISSLLWSISTPAQMERPNPAKTGDTDLAKDEADCKAEGGTFFLAGLAKNHICEHAVVDAGKVCDDNSQCSTRCVAPRDSIVGSAARGVCDPWRFTLGRCANTVKDGKVISPPMCAD